MEKPSTDKKMRKPRVRFIELRKKHFTTQRAAADEFDVSETYVRMLERGISVPSTDLLFKIAHRFGVDVYECWPDISGDKPDNSLKQPSI